MNQKLPHRVDVFLIQVLFLHLQEMYLTATVSALVQADQGVQREGVQGVPLQPWRALLCSSERQHHLHLQHLHL